MDTLALSWLTTPAGADLLAFAADLPPDRLTRLTHLRRRCAPEVAAAAMALLELRHRARAKFARALEMFFTPEGLEQATGDAIARYRASRFPEAIAILDACAGIGGDALALAERGPVVAVDLAPAAAVCVRANAVLLPNPRHTVHTLCTDVTALDLNRLRDRGIAAAFFDPGRRTSNLHGERRRARDSEDYLPPLSWLEALHAVFPALAVKVSPAIEDAALRRYDASVEFLSERGECKEAVLWFGPLAPERPAEAQEENYRATVLRPGAPPATLLPTPCAPLSVSAPQAWLYEPDPAVIRAHRVPQLAVQLQASLLNPEIAYLTAPAYRTTPFATAYRIIEEIPFQLKILQKKLRTLGAQVTAIKKRGVPFEPEALWKHLAGSEAGERPIVVVLCRIDARPVALLCEPPVREGVYVDPR